MMTCKAVATAVSSGTLEAAPLSSRAATWLHLLMCRHCRAFSRQIQALGRLARRASAGPESEPAADLEGRISKVLRAHWP